MRSISTNALGLALASAEVSRWNNDRDTVYFYKPSGTRAGVHSYTKSRYDRDGNGYITFHG